MRKILFSIALLIGLGVVNKAAAQESTSEGAKNEVASKKRQRKQSRAEDRAARKQKKAEEKAIREHHKRIQSKDVLKRMKKNKKRDKQRNTKNVN
jgi:hypothetical protein